MYKVIECSECPNPERKVGQKGAKTCSGACRSRRFRRKKKARLELESEEARLSNGTGNNKNE